MGWVSTLASGAAATSKAIFVDSPGASSSTNASSLGAESGLSAYSPALIDESVSGRWLVISKVTSRVSPAGTVALSATRSNSGCRGATSIRWVSSTAIVESPLVYSVVNRNCRGPGSALPLTSASKENSTDSPAGTVGSAYRRSPTVTRWLCGSTRSTASSTSSGPSLVSVPLTVPV